MKFRGALRPLQGGLEEELETMKALKVYAYEKCGTCKKALKWLDDQGIPYKTVPIREQPPSKAELRRMLKAQDGAIRKLFNTSSRDYKDLNLKERLPDMAADEALDLLHENGNLVKRPFVLGDGVALVGFKEAAWEEALA